MRATRYCGVDGNAKSGKQQRHGGDTIAFCFSISREYRAIVVFLFILMRHDPDFGPEDTRPCRSYC